MTAWVKRPDGRWVKATPINGDDQKPGCMRGFGSGESPRSRARQTCIITPRGHREVLLGRIERARRESRGVR